MCRPMRSEILTRIQQLLTQEDLEGIRVEMREAIEQFRALTKEEVRKQREAWAELPKDPDAVFEYNPAPEEEAFETAVAAFKEREKAWRKQVADEQRDNLEKKKAMLERLRHTIQEEENIGAAFAVFNEVREVWSDVGDVPGDQYKDVHDQYYRLQDEFFYNINIYKELKEHDLKINLKKKEDLIEGAKALVAIESLNDRQKHARALQKQWMDVGPSPRETYTELSDTFFGLIRPVFEEAKAHYDEIRETFKANAEAKTLVIEKLREIVAEEVEASHTAWQKVTTRVLSLQKEWKATGFAGKEHNEPLWAQFRELADVFFGKKQLFYDAQKEVSNAFKAQKLALIERAEALAKSTNWREDGPKMMDLQQEWKTAGACAPRDEQKLWRRFRKAQDTFFSARKTEMAGKIEGEKENLKQKNALIEEVKVFELKGNRKDDLDALKAFSVRWNAIGFVPRKALDKVMESYRAAMDVHYDALSAQKSERAMETYKQRVDNLLESDAQSIRREQRILREKLDRLLNRITKTEENLERFTGKGAESIRTQYEKSMGADKKEVEDIKSKLKMLRQASQKAEVDQGQGDDA
ncbi:MAG: hypothetical protein CL828_09020 [Crocinitomicaceae bacterium]|nr:hypothetical protein [Crocinitomicaceae bacterium]